MATQFEEPKGNKNTNLGKSLRAAVIGLGGISAEHLAYLSGQSPVTKLDKPPARIVGVCDRSRAAADYASNKFGSERSFTDLSEMLAETKPDVLHVLTPPSSHIAIASEGLTAGCHVVCEKPVTPSSEELKTLTALADKHNVHLIESHNYRFNDQITSITEHLEAGKLGHVRDIEIRISLPVTDPAGRFGDPNSPSPIHKMPAGVIHDFTTHFSYLLLHLAPDVEFDRKSAAWSNHSHNPIFRYDDLDALLVGEGEHGPVHARLRFTADCYPDSFSVTVRGSKGWVETDLFQPFDRLTVERSVGSQLTPIANLFANGALMVKSAATNFSGKLLQYGPYHGLHIMLDECYRALARNQKPPITPSEMIKASELVDSLLKDEVRF